MIYTLIVVSFLGSSSTNIAFHDFNSELSCEVARASVTIMVNNPDKIKTICIVNSNVELK